MHVDIKKAKFEMWCDLEENISCIFLQDKSGQNDENMQLKVIITLPVTCYLYTFEQFPVAALRRKIEGYLKGGVK